MSTFLHQIFYNYNKFDDDLKCKELQSYFLTNERKKQILDSSVTEEIQTGGSSHIDTSRPVEILPKENIYYSRKKNPLFWAIYIDIYGYEQYMSITNKYGNVELEEKQKIMDFLKTGYTKMKEVSKKTSKIMMQEWMSELMSAAKMSVNILQVFSVYYKRPIIVYFEENKSHLYFSESSEHSDKLPVVVLVNIDGHFGIHNNFIAIEKINEIMSGICLEDVDKPLKAVSAYKVSELLEIASKCNINVDNLKKPELYEKIWNHLKVTTIK
jgi:hypothetical protein